MSLNTVNSRTDATGDGLVAEFDFTFRILNKTHLHVITLSTLGVATVLECDIDYAVAGVGQSTGGSITLTAGPLAAGAKITILRVLPLTQDTDIRNQREFFPEIHEAVFDRLTMMIQQLQAQADRSLKLPETQDLTALDGDIKPDGGGKILGLSVDGSSFHFYTAAEFMAVGGGGAGVPAGGLAGSVLVKLSDDDGDADWGTFGYSGYSARFGEVINTTNLDSTIRKILNLTYAGPSISLSSSGSGTIREKGATVSSAVLVASLTKKSNALSAVRFYQGATLLYTKTGTIGTTESYTYSTPFSDNISFSTQVDDVLGPDGGPTTASSGVTFTFVYPYYYGVGAAALAASDIALLTKDIRVNTASIPKSFTVNGSQKMYFAQPAIYGDLTAIVDNNGFNTLPSWTKSVKNITGLDGNAISYTVYEFNNYAVATTYPYTFVR